MNTRTCRFQNLCWHPGSKEYVFLHGPQSSLSGVPTNRYDDYEGGRYCVHVRVRVHGHEHLYVYVHAHVNALCVYVRLCASHSLCVRVIVCMPL